MHEIRHAQSESPAERYVYWLCEANDQKTGLDRATNSAERESWKSGKAGYAQG